MSYLLRVRHFISYWLNALDEHSLHSPFLFDFYTTVVKNPPAHPRYKYIEKLRRKLLRNHRTIRVHDLGSSTGRKPIRKISSIARTSLSTPRFSSIYAQLVRHCGARHIIELGTSLGINTLYLSDNKDVRVTTFEGSPAIAEIAALTFEFASRKNIELVVGDIDHTLPDFLQKVSRVDLAFIDANHQYDPTVRYFEWLLRKVNENSVIIVDDIYHSPGMVAAWRYVREHRLVYGSADLFRCGIVFFDPSLNKQHAILQV